MASSIGDDINAATRSCHTTLNQLILQLLPLSIPPNTTSPHLYALGLTHFLPIYTAFESSLHTHTSSAPHPRSSLLQPLNLPPLSRARALEADLSRLLPDPHHVPKGAPLLQAFSSHIRTSTATKPHLLLAYSWIFYMALFSGGRYIRAKLRAGFATDASLPRPITSQQEKARDESYGLGFWNFAGEKDGEDLKVLFKEKVGEISRLLTDEEREEVVAEGVLIMVTLTNVVREAGEMVPGAMERLIEDEERRREFEGGRRGPVARIRPPLLLLVRSLFPKLLMEMLSNARQPPTPVVPPAVHV